MWSIEYFIPNLKTEKIQNCNRKLNLLIITIEKQIVMNIIFYRFCKGQDPILQISERKMSRTDLLDLQSFKWEADFIF